MSDIIFRCPTCGKMMQVPPEKAGIRGRCSRCSTVIIAPQPVERSQPNGVEKLRTKVEGGFKSQEPPFLSERMRANHVIAGMICPGCHKEIELGELVVNCRRCGTPSHDHCNQLAGGCPNPACHKLKESPLPPQPVMNPNISTGVGQSFSPMSSRDIKICPYCGETIAAIARKCRFCNEFLDESLHTNDFQKKISENDNMTWGEVALCILCSGIACIVALVYIVQGKKKGWKMLGLSLLMQLIFIFIQIMAESLG